MKAAINALTLALLEKGWDSFADCKAFATEFFEANADLFSAPAIVPSGKVVPLGGDPLSPYAVVAAEGSDERARVLHVPVVGADGLTDKQRAAVGTVGLCPNCQQPKNDHQVGCSRIDPSYDSKSVTKGTLPPST